MPGSWYLSRLNHILAVFTVAAVALIILGYSAASRMTMAQTELSRLDTVRSATEKVRYDFADVNGWQTAYAFDQARLGPQMVVDTGARRSFLKSLAECRRDLAELIELGKGRSEADRAVLAAVSRGLDDFTRLDGQIIRLYRNGDAASREQGDNLVMGQAITIYTSVSDQLDGFGAGLAQEQSVMVAAASEAGDRAQLLVAVLGILVLIVGLTGSWFIARSIRGQITLAQSEARMTHQALHDSLTGLANRPLLYDHLAHALARAERVGTRVALLFLDLDDFKAINDLLGHAAGDQVLITVSRRLAGVLRGGDLAARLGGDEFVVVCDDLKGPQDIPLVADRVMAALRQPVDVEDRSVPVSMSMGIAVSHPGSHVDDLLRGADAAMYHAKRCGKGRWEIGGKTIGSDCWPGRSGRSG